MIFNDELDISLIISIFFFIGHVLFLYSVFYKDLLNNYEDDNDSKNNENDNSVVNLEDTPKTPQLPYEEKYLIKVRNMKNEYVFTEKELELQDIKLKELEEEENNKKLESVYILNEKIEELTSKLAELVGENESQENSSKQKLNKDDSIIKKIYDSLQNEINSNKKQLLELDGNKINMDDLRERSQKYIIDEQLKEFKNKFIIEIIHIYKYFIIIN
jgi:hypothetical protein